MVSSDISYIFKKLSADIREKISVYLEHVSVSDTEVGLEISSENCHRSRKPGNLKELHLLGLGRRNLRRNVGNCLLAEL